MKNHNPHLQKSLFSSSTPLNSIFNWKEPRPLGLDANAPPSCLRIVAVLPVPSAGVAMAIMAGSATYQICFRLTIPNQNPNPNLNPITDPNPSPNPKNKEKQNDTGIKFNIELLNKYPSNMADRLRQLYHIYDLCEYFQFLHT